MLLAAFLLLASCGNDGMSAAPPSGPARAAALVEAFSASMGVPDRRLDDRNDVSYGSVGLRYDPMTDSMAIRVYVNNVLIDDAPPEELGNYRRMVGFLNDPAVGGMYERAGGQFILDETAQAYFLVKTVPVSALTPALLEAEADRMQDVAAQWTTAWLGEVAMVMHGHQPPPTRRVEAN